MPKGIKIQITPFQKGIDTAFIRKMIKKYNITKTPVTFTVTRDGVDKTIVTKKPVLIGAEYWYLLYKTPKVKCSGVGYVNQYHSPVHASNLAKMQYAFSQTPIRLGEDEIRNLTLVAGSETAARILGLYANSHDAVTCLSEHLMFDKRPSNIEKIEMSTQDIVKTNSIMGVTKHIFASFGVDITPSSSQTLQTDPSTGDMYMPIPE